MFWKQLKCSLESEWINKVCYSVVKNPLANAGDAENGGLIPGSGRSPGGRNDNPLQYSCLENPRTEEPGGLQSIWSQRVGHDLAMEHRGMSRQWSVCYSMLKKK